MEAMAVMEVFCFLRFGGAFGTLGTAVVMTALCKAIQSGAWQGWVDLHEGDHFHAWTGRLIALVNEYASVDGSEADVFRTIVHLERRFFEDSYPQQ